MSNRTAMEFNHDYLSEILQDKEGFIRHLAGWIRGCDPYNAENLRHYGVTVHGTRHHSDKSWADVIKDGSKS